MDFQICPASHLAVVFLVGVGLTIYQSPPDKRSPSALLGSVETRTGQLPWHQVIAPNLLSGFTVSLVSIPLSLAIGIATGAQPMSGIATAAIGGVMSGTFGSSAFNVVGPAGALVGILMRYTHLYGPEVLPWLALVSSLIMAISVWLRLHDYCMFMPKSVFEGFTISVALSIGLGQVDAAFALAPGPPLAVPGLNLSPAVYHLAASLQAFGTLGLPSTILFLVSTTGLLILSRLKPSFQSIVPFAVLACLLGAACDPAALGLLDTHLPTLKDKYGILTPLWVAPLKPLTDIVNSAHNGTYGDVFVGACSVALVAILETLISAKIAAKRSNMPFDTDQELQGLVLSHAACGLCGAMPPTGVFVRASVNQATGCTHRTSQLLQGIFVFLLGSVCMPALSYLPQAAVAAILAQASIKMVPWHYIAHLWAGHRWYLGLLWTVALACWGIDSVTGLVIGTGVSLLLTAKEISRGHAEVLIARRDLENLDSPAADPMACMVAVDVDGGRSPHTPTARWRGHGIQPPDGYEVLSAGKPEKFSLMRQITPDLAACHLLRNESPRNLHLESDCEKVICYKLMGQLDFLTGDSHVDRMQIIAQTGPSSVVLCMEDVPWIDPDGIEALHTMTAMLRAVNATVYLATVRSQLARELKREQWYRELASEKHMQHVFPNLRQALMAALTEGKATRKRRASVA